MNMEQNRHLYFGYGMNTHTEQMAKRCPTAEMIGPATLNNYRFVFRHHADVQLDEDCWVDGLLWSVTEADLKALDQLEGYPSYYHRFRAFVEHDEQKAVAWVYQMNDQGFEEWPSQSYLDMCVEGYTQNGVPLDQIHEALDRVPEHYRQDPVDQSYDPYRYYAGRGAYPL